MEKFRLELTGTAPLLMHSSRLADPLNEATKALKRITGKTKKSEEDHQEMAHLEFQGGLYLDPQAGPFIPGGNIERSLLDGARIFKSGKKIERGLFINTDVNPLAYTGPRDVASLWADENFRLSVSVTVGPARRVMRTRPMFRDWRCDAEGILDTSLLSLEELQEIATVSGTMIGLGDWRPRYGRFTAKVVKA